MNKYILPPNTLMTMKRIHNLTIPSQFKKRGMMRKVKIKKNKHLRKTNKRKLMIKKNQNYQKILLPSYLKTAPLKTRSLSKSMGISTKESGQMMSIKSS